MLNGLAFAAVVVLALGLVLLVFAFMSTRNEKDGHVLRGQTYGMLGAVLLAAAGVTIAISSLQRTAQDAQKETAWRDSLAAASRLTGFDPGRHPVRNMTFSGKDLRDAQFNGKDLTGSYMNDANLDAVNFTDATLVNVNFQSSSLSHAVLRHADLAGANLKGVTLGKADVTGLVSLKGALVDAYTCWPAHFLGNPLLKEVVVQKVLNQNGKPVLPSAGKEWPSCNKKPSGG
ncbi:pentapeptide repeat-containing protein [Streptomyces sp. NPDC005728]|uniref:pentapeptide repeat-containing protein n=1 Tax=Streptomyces sp. NPDC005728 TaxID=3157054 RepID=UPI0033EFFBA9